MADIIGRNTPPGDGDGFKSTTTLQHCSLQLRWGSRTVVSHSILTLEYILTLVQTLHTILCL